MDFTKPLLILAFFGLCANGKETGLPDLPPYYSANIQVNIVNILRGNERGQSITFFEAVDDVDNKAVLKYSAELAPFQEGNDPFRLSETIIWNPAIEGIKAFLSVAEFDAPVPSTYCQADNLHDNSILQAIFGLDNGHLPTLSGILHFGPGEGYTEGSPQMIKQIPCRSFSAHWDIPEIEGSFNITYHWSSAQEWISTAGRNISVPVMASINGICHQKPDDQDLKMVDIEIDFSDYFVSKPDPELFQPPSDIWCEGREMGLTLPIIPNYFSYTSELIYYYDYEGDDVEPIIAVSTRNEWYDYKLKTSRTDYKPYDITNLDDPFAGKTGFISEVKDFSSGIKYQTWKLYGNCSMSFIGLDPIGDVTINPDGSIHMTTPFEFFGTDKKFASNGQSRHRGIGMTAYVTMDAQFHRGHGEVRNMTTALYLSEGEYAVVGNDNPQFLVPVKMEKYDAKKYNDKKGRHNYNIIGFRKGEPDFNLFDITQCFHDYEIDHRVIKFAWDETYVVKDNIKESRDFARAALTEAAQVSPIRIQNIQINEEPADKAIYVIFTLVDFRHNIEGVDESALPDNVKIPLPLAMVNLKKSIESGNFKMNLRRVDGDVGAVYAVKDYWVSVDRTPGGGGTINNNPNNYKYTGGSMAGLAFGMIALGLVLSGGVYFFVLRPRVRSQLPTVRGFDNPLHGSANLAATT